MSHGQYTLGKNPNIPNDLDFIRPECFDENGIPNIRKMTQREINQLAERDANLNISAAQSECQKLLNATTAFEDAHFGKHANDISPEYGDD